jgi:hypothetical protein
VSGEIKGDGFTAKFTAAAAIEQAVKVSSRLRVHVLRVFAVNQ